MMKNILKLTTLFLLAPMAAGIGGNSAGAAPPKPWSSFDPPPMTIVYPEEDALANPPLIQWQPLEGADHYRVKIINPDITLTWETPWNFYTPEEALERGTYNLTVEAVDENGEVMEPAAEGAMRITESGLDGPISLNNISAPKDTPILLTPDQIERIANATGEAAEFRERLLEKADDPSSKVTEPIEEPERYENFEWDFDTWHANNQYVSALEEGIIVNTMAYVIEEDQENLDRAKRLMLEISKWDPTGATGVWENDHSAQSILHALSIGYNTLKDELTEEEREAIADSISARCADMYDLLNPMVMKETSSGPMNDPANNHPWFCTSALGMGALALMGEDPRASEWSSYASQLYWGVFLPKGGKDGGWHEGIDYWSYALFFVYQYLDTLKTTADVNLYRNSWLKNTAFFKMYVHPPVGAYVPFGDCKHHKPNAFDKVIMMRNASQYNDPMAWKYVDAIEDEIETPKYLFWSLLWSDRTGAQKELPELPRSQHFEDIGWVVSNNSLFDEEDQVLFAMRSGPFFGRSFGHSHADQNSFVFTAGGEKLLWDAGYYDSYLSDHHRHYSRLSKAHNTILVDGKGQVVHTDGLDGKITEYEETDDKLHVRGDASKDLIYGGRLVHFYRDFDYEYGKKLTITDDIMARELSNLSFLLHSAYPIVWHPGDKTVRISGDKYELHGKFETEKDVEAIVRYGFYYEPDLPSKVLEDEIEYPGQFHLELRTMDKVEKWKPKLTLELKKK